MLRLSSALAFLLLSPRPSGAAQPPAPSSPIKLVPTRLDDAAKGEWPSANDPDIPDPEQHGAPCQPPDFNPGADTSTRGAGLNEFNESTLDVVVSTDTTWRPQHDAVVQSARLPEPFAFKAHIFTCEMYDVADKSAVIEIARSGRRHALYQHVRGFSLSKDGSTLYLDNARRVSKGDYRMFVGLVDVASKKKTPLPRLPCVTRGRSPDGFASFSGNRLVTINDDGEQDVCVWEKDGTLTYRARIPFNWHTGDAARYMFERVGLLPGEPDTLYAYGGFGSKQCRLWLQSLKDQSQAASVSYGEIGPSSMEGVGKDCPTVELDLSAARLRGGPVRFRREKPDSSEYSDWETLTIPAQP